MITIPFDLELTKKINNGERNGMIVTDGDNYRVEFVYHREESFPILGVIHTDHGIISDLNSTSMRNTCPEFPLFGANYPDATCIDGILYDLDNVGDDGVLIKPLEEIPCPFCRTEEFIRYDPFNKEYSMDSEEDIRDWYMSYINEMRNKYGGK